MPKHTRPVIGRCEDCRDPATVTLVNGAEKTTLCDACLRDQAGDIVMDNDHVIFAWNEARDEVRLG